MISIEKTGKLVRKILHIIDLSLTKPDDPEIYDTAPVGLQIVGRTLDEERILSVAQIAYDALNCA
jgi:hypothetical protein